MEEKPKTEKKKKEISPERKKQLLEQLKKAREKAAANRKAKAEAKKASATKEAKKDTAKKQPSKPKKDAKDLEIERLNEKIKNFTLQDIARQSKPAPKPKKEKKEPVVKSAAVEDSDVENQVLSPIEEDTPVPPDSEDEYTEPKRTASPTPIPDPPKEVPKQEEIQSKPQTPAQIETPKNIQNTIPQVKPPSPPQKKVKNLYKKKKMRR